MFAVFTQSCWGYADKHGYIDFKCGVYIPVLNMIRFPDRDPTGFCNSEPDPDRTGFGKKLYRIRYGYPNCFDHCSQMLNQGVFQDLNRLGSNIWTRLPD